MLPLIKRGRIKALENIIFIGQSVSVGDPGVRVDSVEAT